MLAALLSAIISSVLPVILKLVQQHLPPASGSRAQARQWVVDALNEVVQGLNVHGLVPAWVQALESPVESLLAQAIDAALDKAGY